MANTENLKPKDSNQSREEAKINGRKGGIKSGEVRREKKLLRSLLEEALLKETKTGNNAVDITNAIIKKAKKGNVKAYEVIRDTIGEKPKENIGFEVNPEAVKILSSINKQLGDKK